MDLTLSGEDVLTLQALLRDYLPGLKYEVTRTDARDLRHILLKRQTLCERILERLE